MKKTIKQLMHDLKGATIELVSYKFKGEPLSHNFLNLKREVESVHSNFIKIKNDDGISSRLEFKNCKTTYEDDLFTITIKDQLEMIYKISNINNSVPLLSNREEKIKKMIEKLNLKDNSVILYNDKQAIFNSTAHALAFLTTNKVNNLKEIPLEEKDDSFKKIISAIDSKSGYDCFLKDIKIIDFYTLFDSKRFLRFNYHKKNWFNKEYSQLTIDRRFLNEVFTLLNASTCKKINVYIRSEFDPIKIEFGLDYCYLVEINRNFLKDKEDYITDYYCEEL